MKFIEMIALKRDGGALDQTGINRMVQFICDENIPDFQISALLMAIYLRGMSEDEIAWLTLAMAKSGETIDLSHIGGIVVDKHSTGGVGDKTSLVLMPMIAAAGLRTAKISGKGLGHTGGTLDKLSVFEGFRYNLSREEIVRAVMEKGIVLTGSTDHLVPADKRMYALRDLTATVDSLPLIASSIMSKKIAAGAGAILLDVKVGNGAIIEDLDRARKLALALVSIGNHLQVPTKAVLTDMSTPLGKAIGNALEVREAIETLKGQGHAKLRNLCLKLGARLLLLAGKSATLESAENELIKILDSGKALEQFRILIENQGGSSRYLDYPEELPVAAYQKTLVAAESGYISAIHAKKIGIASMYSGAGRISKDQNLDLGAGIYLHKERGDQVAKGEALMTVYATDVSKLEQAFRLAATAIGFTNQMVADLPLLIEEI